MTDQLKSILKYLLSYSKKEWNLDDYPIRFRYTNFSNFKLGPNESTLSAKRFIPIPWSAQIINWPQMQGGGDTKVKAFEDLVKNFNERKENGENFPRPGKGLPIEFASTEKIEKHKHVAVDFFEKILNSDYEAVFISDQSSLWDFVFDDSLDSYFVKIKQTYGPWPRCAPGTACSS